MTMSAKLFETALGIVEPWYVQGVDFDAAKKMLTIAVDFVAGSRFALPGVEGAHPAHDTVSKRYRHLNFFQHECYLEVRMPRVRLPDGSTRLVEPDWAGKLVGFTLLFEALVLALCQQMPFAAVARTVGESWHRVHAICSRYVELAVAEADLSETRCLAIDETSYRRGHNYLTLAADADERKVVFVTEGRDAETIHRLAGHLSEHQASPDQVAAVSIDMSPAFIKGVTEHLPNARITFDKLHVVAHASTAVDQTRRLEQKTDPDLKGLRWALLKDRDRLPASQRAARAWLYREQLREILDRKQINVVSAMLAQWCTNVMRQGRTHEGCGPPHPQPLRRHRRLDPDPPDQRLPRSLEWPVPGGQAQGPRLHPLRHHAHRALPHRRQAQFRPDQPACRLTHSFFKRAISTAC
jgi:transposase